MTYSEIKSILQQPYSLQNFKALIDDIFPQPGKYLETQQLFEESDKINKGFQFGNINLADGKSIALFDVEVADSIHITKNRKGLRDIAIKYIDNGIINGALVAFHSPNKADYRLSFMAKQAGFTEDGDFVSTQTAPKRYTFILGKNESCTTAAKRLAELKEKTATITGLQAVIDAFSVDKLNKDFFKGYKEHYEKFWKYLNAQPQYRSFLIENSSDATSSISQDKQEKPIRDFAKKLLGRIVFLYFLQKKGWMGSTIAPKSGTKVWSNGDPNFIKNLFLDFSNKQHFYSQVLTQLFFETLNTKRNNDTFTPIGGKGAVLVPYLNGGLFDNDLPETNHFDFPESYFAELFDFFDQYNFTIDENDPDDANVGIDPEMLGHIFENLLEENKDKGAFYTPKAIVQYMCQESLIQYLATATNADLVTLEELSNLIRHNDRGKNKGFITQNAQKIEELLDNVKICDPAIGSGAFPMGMLNEIFKAKMTLDLTLDPAEVKRHIIQNSIYGVDLDRGAVDIARLRFWLALVVEEDTPSPLPNLDYKIMQGNSLLESFEGIPLSHLQQTQTAITVFEKGTQTDIFGAITPVSTELLATKRQDLDELIDAYFDADSQHKAQIKSQINTIVHEHLHYNVDLKLAEVETKIATHEDELSLININKNDPKAKKEQKQKVLAIKQKAIEKLQNEQERLQNALLTLDHIQETNDRPYFLWHLFFKDVFEQGGFDIVIGNPPYVQLQKLGHDADKLQAAGYKTFVRTGDLYCLFYEMGSKFLKVNGILAYITSNKFIKSNYGKELRHYLNQFSFHSIIDFGELPVFESAATFPVICLIEKRTPYKSVDYLEVKTLKYNSLYDYLAKFKNPLPFSIFQTIDWELSNDFSSSLMKKMQEKSTRLADYVEGEILFGIKTGLNEAFIIDEPTKNSLINEDFKSSEIIIPLLNGNDVRKYEINYANEYLIATKIGVKIEDYPAIFKHLSQYKEKLKVRSDKGKFWWELRSCAYYDAFENPKILYPDIALESRFTIDYDGFYPNATLFTIPRADKYLLGLLNSRLIWFYLSRICPVLGDVNKRGRLRLKTVYLKGLPIIVPTEIQKTKIETLANQILSDKKAGKDTAVLEAEIDRLVYELYGLTEAEIATVELR